MSENLRPNVCGKYALQGSSRALFTPLYPTHKQCTWPVPFHQVGCAVLIWSGSDLVVWCDGGGLFWWADFGGLVWQWSAVGVGAWSDLWSDLMGCWCGLIPWPNLEVSLRKMVWSDGRLKIRKMRSWGNSSEKALNALRNYRKRNEKNIRKCFIFQIQLQLKTLLSWKDLKRLNQINTGLCCLCN